VQPAAAAPPARHAQDNQGGIASQLAQLHVSDVRVRATAAAGTTRHIPAHVCLCMRCGDSWPTHRRTRSGCSNRAMHCSSKR
jgi:hypothetical protein